MAPTEPPAPSPTIPPSEPRDEVERVHINGNGEMEVRGIPLMEIFGSEEPLPIVIPEPPTRPSAAQKEALKQRLLSFATAAESKIPSWVIDARNPDESQQKCLKVLRSLAMDAGKKSPDAALLSSILLPPLA